MMKDRTANRLQKEFDRESYDYVDSIGLIGILALNGVKPTTIELNGKLKNGMDKKAAIYLKNDIEYKNIKSKWDNGEFDLYKLYNKKCGKVKRMLFKGDISLLN